MGRCAPTLLIAWLWLGGCSESPAPAPDPVERELEIAREQLHQTREVIRYMEIEQRLQREMLNPLNDVPDATPEPAESAERR